METATIQNITNPFHYKKQGTNSRNNIEQNNMIFTNEQNLNTQFAICKFENVTFKT